MCKQEILGKVGPLQYSVGNGISDGFQIAMDVNECFNSLFTREYISSLPLPVMEFKDDESNQLKQFL